jgi:hypothetical protein
MLALAAAAVVLLVLGAIYWSFRSELGSVRKEAGLLTTEYKNVRPKNKDAEKRILAAAQEVDAALTALEQARTNTTTAAEYKLAMEKVQKIQTKPVQAASTTDESIFAMEVSKPLNERLAKISPEYTEELKRRLIDEATRAYEKKRDEEKAQKK